MTKQEVLRCEDCPYVAPDKDCPFVSSARTALESYNPDPSPGRMARVIFVKYVLPSSRQFYGDLPPIDGYDARFGDEFFTKIKPKLLKNHERNSYNNYIPHGYNRISNVTPEDIVIIVKALKDKCRETLASRRQHAIESSAGRRALSELGLLF